MKKIIFSALALLATLSISAQTIKVYEYDSEGNLSSTPAYTSTNKVKVVFEAASTDPQPGDKVEGTTTINGTTYTKAAGGTVADYVDLGFTVDGQKVLWATHNLGASMPDEAGAYIAWGENCTEEEGYSDGLKEAGYDWSTLKYCNGTSKSFTKYVINSDYGTVDNKTTLESEDDAATVNWGSDWRTPTPAEIAALKSSCTWTWYDLGNDEFNGVSGYKITGTNENYIFLPAAGYYDGSESTKVSVFGTYWSNSLTQLWTNAARQYFFRSWTTSWNDNYRCHGNSLRPVRSE